MLMRVLSWPSKRKNKIVILDHVFMHDPDLPHGEENLASFKTFLRYAKTVGFEFRQVNTYLTD